ncbi:MAG: hypothetical protein ACRDBO_10045 [Lachnospiraceae bacterium]
MGDIIEKLRLVLAGSVKEVNADKKELIMMLYNGLLAEFDAEDGVEIEIEDNNDSVTMRLIFDELCISEYLLYLNAILLLAEAKFIRIKEQKVVLELWFRCWEYKVEGQTK